MKNISFTANLKIDNNLYKNLPKGTSRDFPNKLISEYKAFLEMPKIKQATEGDIIQIKKAKHKPGFALELEFISDKLKEPFKTGIYTNKNIPDFKSQDLKYWTYIFLCAKKNEKPRAFESSFRMIERVLFDGQRIFKK